MPLHLAGQLQQVPLGEGVPFEGVRRHQPGHEAAALPPEPPAAGDAVQQLQGQERGGAPQVAVDGQDALVGVEALVLREAAGAAAPAR